MYYAYKNFIRTLYRNKRWESRKVVSTATKICNIKKGTPEIMFILVKFYLYP